MRFEFYHPGLDPLPKLSVDGLVPGGIDLSHWRGNRTPSTLKADTSTEIALNFVASRDRERIANGVELVVNNHFDTDGTLSVWTILNGPRALDLREKLIAAAEAGDFSEYSTDDGVRASIVIQGSEGVGGDDDAGSPLAISLAGERVEDARAYQLVLPHVERVISHTDEFEPLWRKGWTRISRALESFARGDSRVEEEDEHTLSVITLAHDVATSTPYIAISRHARGRLYLIAAPMRDGWSYRIDYPYYSWAETIRRPPIERRDFGALVEELNALETDPAGNWQTDSTELSSAVKYLDRERRFAASRLTPDVVARKVRAGLSERKGGR